MVGGWCSSAISESVMFWVDYSERVSARCLA